MQSPKNYYLGLDIGTDSVGYAATDLEYTLRKFRGEAAWGVTLFDAASSTAERRAHRVDRRRLDRRQQRVRLLQELFASEMGKVDARFFIRQAESALYPSDRGEPCALFNDPGFTDADYHRRYPTIHHLIDELMTSDAPHDVRLVYLACAWLAAHRGHFLNQIDANNIEAVMDFRQVYGALRNCLIGMECAIPWREDHLAEMEQVLRAEAGFTQKHKALTRAAFEGGKAPKEGTEEFPFQCAVMFRLLAGGKAAASDLFFKDPYKELERNSFSLDTADEDLEKLYADLGDDAELVKRLKAIYDWSVLSRVLKSDGSGVSTISRAKVRAYEQHAADLALLKRLTRRYIPEKYAALFREDGADNYVAYSRHGAGENTKPTDQEKFCKTVKGLFKGVTPDAEDAADFQAMMERLESKQFMPKQKSGDNRVIPCQLYLYELNQLLLRAEGYLPFLSERDGDGLTVSDKIRSVFLYRVPYYVGPLGAQGNPKTHWAVRKPGRILPWNFDAMVDRDASEEVFIRRMTNVCTYLPGEPVLPKESLLYHRFTVLNEINNLKINDQPITVAQKQAIYNEVFMKHPRVTLKRLKDYLLSSGIMGKSDALSGVDETIKSNLKPAFDFRRLLESGGLTEEDAEAIIQRRTYTEDHGRFRRWLEKEYPSLSDEDARYLARLNYRDFGRLSRRFLAEFEGERRETGAVTTIMQALWESNDNLMELMSDRYTFREKVEEAREDYYREHPKSITERLEDMYVPAAVRRPVLRALEITAEVVKALGGPPKRIFVEMARGGLPEQKGRRTQTRRVQLMALYDQCRDEDAPLMRERLEAMGDDADTRLQSEKLYLYYLQLGRCMYTGQPIDLNALMNDKRYDIDHIYPQSLVKDDSILNNKVLVATGENARKGNGIVPEDVRQARRDWWERLRKCGFINDEKFKRLTRTAPFTEDEKWGFINRQMTETTQSTKAVATLLKERYPDAEIVYVKARLAAEFRQAFDCLKSRDFNDLHHARDAYLNIVAGNVYHEKFSRRWFSPNDPYSMRTEIIFTRPVICGGKTVWAGTAALERVKQTLRKNNAHLTRYAFRRQGGFFDQQPVKKAPGLIPLKKGLDTEKYGGYNKPAISFFALAKYTMGKKTDVMFMPVELLIAPRYLADPEYRRQYALEKIAKIWGKPVKDVSFPLGDRIIRVNTMLSLDGFRACITGNSSYGKVIVLSGQMPFVADYEVERYVKRLRSLTDKLANNPKYVFREVEDHVTAEENLRLYDLYVQKLRDTVYSKRPNHPLEILQKGREKFTRLTVPEQAAALLNIHMAFGRVAGGVDLSAIGGGARAAASTKSSALSNWLKTNQDVRIIDQSASGLWETRSGNLLELL